MPREEIEIPEDNSPESKDGCFEIFLIIGIIIFILINILMVGVCVIRWIHDDAILWNEIKKVYSEVPGLFKRLF